jgi:hypothetical protein
MAIDEQEFGEMRSDVKQIKIKLDDLDKKLFGNGQAGIIDKILRSLEEQNTRSATNKAALDAQVVVSMSLIKNFCIAHWKAILLTITAIFLVIHSILPANASIWDIIKLLP